MHSADEVDGERWPGRSEPAPTPGPVAWPRDPATTRTTIADDDWAEPDGRYLVYVGYTPGPPFAERGLPVPAGTVLVDDDGTGATVALPDLPLDAVIEVLGSWARAVLGGTAIGGLWWATTFADDEDDEDDDETERTATDRTDGRSAPDRPASAVWGRAAP